MTDDQLEKLRKTLSDFYRVLHWVDPFDADRFMKKTIEELGGQVLFLNGNNHGRSNLTAKFQGETCRTIPELTGYHQDESGIYVMHSSHACCALDEDLAMKILVLGMPGNTVPPV